MDKHKKHVHSRHKKVLKRLGWTVLTVAVLLIIGVWAWKSPVVQSRVQASFGNNAAYQKKEYNKQRSLEKEKYGEQSDSDDSAKTTDKKTKKATSDQKDSSKKSDGNKKYTYVTVQQGEYLSTIADDYNTTVDELISLNNLESRDISAGVQIKVPTDDTNNSSENTSDDSTSQTTEDTEQSSDTETMPE